MIRDEQISRLMGAGALALLLGALGLQYAAHLAPCEMCHWQRWPYIAAALIGLVAAGKNDARILAIVVLALAAVLGVAAAYQWGMLAGWQPKLIAAALIGLICAAAWKKDARSLAIVTIALIAISGLIGAYQAGMQWGILPGPDACSVAHPYVMGSGAPPPQVSCNAVTWSLFGLSLAAYNALLSFLIAGTGAFLLSRKNAA
jgi:disulfide bond formation protein DsbB